MMSETLEAEGIFNHINASFEPHSGFSQIEFGTHCVAEFEIDWRLAYDSDSQIRWAYAQVKSYLTKGIEFMAFSDKIDSRSRL